KGNHLATGNSGCLRFWRPNRGPLAQRGPYRENQARLYLLESAWRGSELSFGRPPARPGRDAAETPQLGFVDRDRADAAFCAGSLSSSQMAGLAGFRDWLVGRHRLSFVRCRLEGTRPEGAEECLRRSATVVERFLLAAH